MKLRNKKTGEIANSIDIQYDEFVIYVKGKVVAYYTSLSELNEDWEDYTSQEPLIKNEKIRKAVRAWAEACHLRYVTYKLSSNEFYDPSTRGAFAINFKLIPVEVYLEDGESYTITELCGEEE